MNYMLLIYGEAPGTTPMTDDEMSAMMGEYFAFTQAILASGEMVSGEALEAPDTATTVTVRNGTKVVTDGPYAETKEVLGGYYIVKVDSLERAQELASQIPGAKQGRIEVRPVMEFPA